MNVPKREAHFEAGQRVRVIQTSGEIAGGEIVIRCGKWSEGDWYVRLDARDGPPEPFFEYQMEVER